MKNYNRLKSFNKYVPVDNFISYHCKKPNNTVSYKQLFSTWNKEKFYEVFVKSRLASTLCLLCSNHNICSVYLVTPDELSMPPLLNPQCNKLFKICLKSLKGTYYYTFCNGPS